MSSTYSPVTILFIILTGAILWFFSHALLIIFAGILFGLFIDAAVRGLGYAIAIPRPVRLAIVVILFLLAVGGFFITSGSVVVQQSGDIVNALDNQLNRLKTWLETTGLQDASGEGLTKWLPDASVLVGGATSAFTGALGFIGSAVVVVMIGIYVAVSPTPYHDGLIRLFPPKKRARISKVMDEVGIKLRWWLAGMAISMSVVAGLYWIGLMAIGMPNALSLALLAGALAFIPNLGPLLAAVPIIIVGLSQSPFMAALAIGIYVIVQTFESYLITPQVQKRMVHLYPAFILSIQLIFALAFGILGLALATPLAAATQVMVQRLYIEDTLGDEAVDNA